MVAIVTLLVGLFLGWKLGRKYQDFQDIMLARRVAKIVSQREQLAKEQGEFNRVMREEQLMAKEGANS